MAASESPTFERVVIERAELLNQRTVLRSALEYVVEECKDPELVEVCQAALEQTEAGS